MTKTARSSEPRRSASAASGTPRGTVARRLPQRTWVACRTVRPKRELVRVVRAPDGTLSVDLRGKAPGRGAYLDPDPVCLERGLREGALARALAVAIDDATAERLKVEVAQAARARKKETS